MNVRPKILKPFEEKWNKFSEFGLGHDFLDMTSEEQATKERIC
jgi:hypothetical protein